MMRRPCQAYALARQRSGLNRMMAGLYSLSALAPLACGDSSTAQKWADETVALSPTVAICRWRC